MKPVRLAGSLLIMVAMYIFIVLAINYCLYSIDVNFNGIAVSQAIESIVSCLIAAMCVGYVATKYFKYTSIYYALLIGVIIALFTPKYAIDSIIWTIFGSGRGILWKEIATIGLISICLVATVVFTFCISKERRSTNEQIDSSF